MGSDLHAVRVQHGYSALQLALVRTSLVDDLQYDGIQALMI